jgi:hypothetical protein
MRDKGFVRGRRRVRAAEAGAKAGSRKHAQFHYKSDAALFSTSAPQQGLLVKSSYLSET